ncbi:right-handed parallel beta-helix repeat-containing protein [Dyella subtropica]|uniref:right-handed parallel beta-helix repeat-containing protein n=1 Tax=Dyella subtropica TaxID=2992127 RepID=UPI002250899F|nr:right-handed parallel beta-helix repeat-containing protein [Dyella subtropica]
MAVSPQITDFHKEEESMKTLPMIRMAAIAAMISFALFGVRPAAAEAPSLALAPAPVAMTVCGNASVLTGPLAPPVGAITVPAGDNSSVNFNQAGKTFWFAPGTHTLGTDPYGQIIPANNSTFIGAPGAILDGKNLNLYAFTGQATGVTIEYLTIQNFGAAGANNNEGVVNHDAGHGWTIQYNTVQGNAGAGVFVGSSDVVQSNCLTHNGQYGFSAYEDNGVSNVVIDHNEISYNNTYGWETAQPGCGCTGGGKFWATNTATITNNWFHHNHEGPGLWADTNNNDFDIENNVFSDEENSGIIYETSYNALIKNNTFLRNANVSGPTNPGFPTGAIYLSESGGDSRVSARYQTLTVANNMFTDNWSGVVIWENADRFCNSPADTSTGECTLVNPRVVNLSTCVAGTINNSPNYSDCRWKSQNILVNNNVFSLTPANIGSNCTVSNSCGFQGIFSNWGSYPSWSPYQGQVIEQAITFSQGNVFSNNTYVGPWQFMAHDQGVTLTPAQWQAAPYSQDAGSSFH